MRICRNCGFRCPQGPYCLTCGSTIFVKLDDVHVLKRKQKVKAIQPIEEFDCRPAGVGQEMQNSLEPLRLRRKFVAAHEQEESLVRRILHLVGI